MIKTHSQSNEQKREFIIKLYQKLQSISESYQSSTQDKICIPKLPSKDITYDQILLLIPLRNGNSPFSIQLLISDIFKKDLHLNPQTTGPMIANLQKIYEQLVRQSKPNELSIWMLIHLSCLCKKLGQKVIGALRFYQWKNQIKNIVNSNNQNNLNINNLMGDQIEVGLVLRRISNYKIHYSEYEEVGQQLYQLEQIENEMVKEQQIFNQLKFHLMIISSLLVPQNSHLLFDKLKMMNPRWINNLSLSGVQQYFRYDVKRPENIKALLKKKESDGKTKYFQISLKQKIEESNGIIDERFYINEVRFLGKEKRRQLLISVLQSSEKTKQILKKGDIFKHYLMENPDEFVVKGEIKEIHRILYNQQVWILSKTKVQEIKQFKGQFNIRQFDKIQELKKAYFEQTSKDFIIMLPSSINILEHPAESLIFYLDQEGFSNANKYQPLIQKFQSLKKQKQRKLQYETPNFELLTENPKFHQKIKLITWMLRPQNTQKAASDFAYFCRQIQKIEGEFQKSQIEDFAEDIENLKLLKDIFYTIKKYSTDMLSKLINLSARKLNDSRHLAYIRHPFACLYHAVLELCYQQRNEQFRKTTFKCFRGCNLTYLEIKKFQNNIGEYFQCEGFLSTSLSEDIAINFIKNRHYNCLICIRVSPQKFWLPGFADISMHSEQSSQKQIIFNPTSMFKAIDVRKEQQITRIELQFRTWLKEEGDPYLYRTKQWDQVRQTCHKKQWLLSSQRRDLRENMKLIRNQGDLNEGIHHYYHSMVVSRVKGLRQNSDQMFKTGIQKIKSFKIKLPSILLTALNPDQQKSSNFMSIEEFLSAIEICGDECSYLMISMIQEAKLLPIQKIQLYRSYQQYIFAKRSIQHTLAKNYFIEAGFVVQHIARIYLSLGKLSEAQQCLDECLQFDEKSNPDQCNFQFFQCYELLGYIYQHSGRIKEALQMYQHCIRLIENHGWAVNDYYGKFKMKIANILNNDKQQIEAQDSYMSALEHLKPIHGKQKSYKECLLKLCEFYFKNSDFCKIQPFFIELLELLEEDQQTEDLLSFHPNWWHQISVSFYKTTKYFEATFCQCILFLILNNSEQQKIKFHGSLFQKPELNQKLIEKVEKIELFEFVKYFLEERTKQK